MGGIEGMLGEGTGEEEEGETAVGMQNKERKNT